MCLDPSGFYRFNCDVAWKSQFSHAAMFIIVTNNVGLIVYGITKQVHCLSTIAGEARALLKVIKFAFALSLQHGEFEIDFSVLYNALQCPFNFFFRKIRITVAFIVQIASRIQKVSYQYIPYVANCWAYIMAKLVFATCYHWIGYLIVYLFFKLYCKFCYIFAALKCNFLLIKKVTIMMNIEI